MKIYLLQEGQEFGPFEMAEIFAKLAEGTLTPKDQARREGDTEWKTLDEIMKGGGASLFSVEQLDQIQADSPPAPVVIPDFQPSHPRHEDDGMERKNGFPIGFVSAVFLLIAAGVVGFRWETGKMSRAAAVSAPPVAPIGSQVAAQPAPFPSPSANQRTTNLISANQPSQDTTPSHVASSSAVPQPATASNPTPPPHLASPPVKPQSKNLSSTNQPLPAPTPPRTTSSIVVPQPTLVPNLSTKPTPPPFSAPVVVSDFFKIESVQFLKKESKSKIGVWHFNGPHVNGPPQFLQCLEVKVCAAENTRSDQTFARAYFFDDWNKQIVCRTKPSPSGKPISKGAQFEMPVLFYKDKPDCIYFEIPQDVKDKNWKAVVVFGDKHEAQAACFPPTTSDFLTDYPEKRLVHDRTGRIARKPAMDPLIQYEVKTKNPRQPKITLFLRPPKGISDAREVQGVLALCILAGGIEDIKRDLQKEEMSGDYNGLLGFANTHKLAILAWGSSGLWNPGANYEDLPKDKAVAMDKSFDLVADAWERGVHELGDKYGIPQQDFLLWGYCGSAQWAHRLCLRKPDYFLAIDIHIPGSFDKPTPEASKVIWCLTTGELYGGYERSLRFVAACKKLGYPIVFKAIVGLGHAGHPDATAMGFKFFEFALTQKAARDEYDKRVASAFARAQMAPNAAPTPWPEAFQHPPFYGDIVNQEMFPPDQAGVIPKGFRIPIPTKEIANIWIRSH